MITVYIGPIILGLLLGFVLGTRIRDVPESGLKFNASVYLLFIIVAFIMAYALGPFPYYIDTPFASGFVAAAVGIILGKLTFGRGTKPQKTED
ncbi:energy-converting hydrogenase B subunit J [Methanobacterium sp.]|uniref:energy-converting hydrogenase B subunit J n=1 Tax=Methanobacterium sp. TaxID=2164 RepID=UPI0025E0A922|nr:energy-converting hydrogenase B subunit J [Methanobacterium sp.]MDY9923834.1 energy-converting hydrogenase B subunit J [Methanobacterium sp.]